MSASLWLVVTIVAVGAFATWLRRRQPPSEAQDGDLAVIEQLEKAGSDLSKPHPIEFFLYFPTQDAATTAASRVQSRGFSADVRQGADGGNWLCLLTKDLRPEHATMVRIRREFEQLAADLDGDYDGWGTPIVS